MKLNGNLDPGTPAGFPFADLEIGMVAPAEAKAFVAKALASERSEWFAEQLYESLRVLTCRILGDRLSSNELRGWQGAINSMSVQFDGLKGLWGTKIEVLAEVLHDRVGMVESRTADDVLRRRHAKEVLEVLGQTAPQSLARSEVRARLGLEEANLSRVLTLLRDAGLIERERLGKAALFALSATGRAALLELQDRPNNMRFDLASWTVGSEPKFDEYEFDLENNPEFYANDDFDEVALAA